MCQKIVLFDLDGTIMRSEEARLDGWEKALKEIKLKNNDEETKLLAYKAIYNCHADFTGKTGPGGHVFEDMRQEWNSRMSYALLIAWCNFHQLPEQKNDDAFKKDLKLILGRNSERDLLFETAEMLYDEWELEYAHQINNARDKFWSGDLSQYLYEGVVDLLRNLYMKNIKYFIATEGHLPTQWNKICALGLHLPDKIIGQPLIKQEIVLTTSQAARPRREMEALNSLIGWYEGKFSAGEEAKSIIGDESIAKKLLPKTNEAKSMAEGLSRMRRLLRRFAKKMNKDTQGEVQAEFFLRVIYAVKKPTENTREQLNDLGHLDWNNDINIKLAMVGDKFESDMEPILTLAKKLNTKIMAIWVRQGSHGSKNVNLTGIKSNCIPCNTIREAGDKYLLNENEWGKRTEPITRPVPLFPNAIEPNDEEDETLEGNISSFLFGIAAVENQNIDSLKFDKLVYERARKFVTIIKNMVVDDIRVSESRAKIINYLTKLVVNKYPTLSTKPVILSLIELLLDVSKNINGTYENNCLELLSEQLNKKYINWAASVILVLSKNSNKASEYILQNDILRNKYYSKLSYFTRVKPDKLPTDFPNDKARSLHTKFSPSPFVIFTENVSEKMPV
jgi:phosphoglycolate phosphatase-like HAD superfamily hydrolase